MLFFRQSSSQTFIFLISYIYFSSTYVYTADSFQSYARLCCDFILCSLSFFCSCSLHARYVCFFFSLVMLLALTRFNFFQVFSLLRALSNLFLPATCPRLWFLQLRASAVSQYRHLYTHSNVDYGWSILSDSETIKITAHHRILCQTISIIINVNFVIHVRASLTHL